MSESKIDQNLPVGEAWAQLDFSSFDSFMGGLSQLIVSLSHTMMLAIGAPETMFTFGLVITFLIYQTARSVTADLILKVRIARFREVIAVSLTTGMIAALAWIVVTGQWSAIVLLLVAFGMSRAQTTEAIYWEGLDYRIRRRVWPKAEPGTARGRIIRFLRRFTVARWRAFKRIDAWFPEEQIEPVETKPAFAPFACVFEPIVKARDAFERAFPASGYAVPYASVTMLCTVSGLTLLSWLYAAVLAAN